MKGIQMANPSVADPDPVADTQHHLRNALAGSYNQMRAAFISTDKLIWENPFGLTPQDVFTSLGRRGESVVNHLTALRQAVNATAPVGSGVASSKPGGVTVTLNPDGTVTLS